MIPFSYHPPMRFVKDNQKGKVELLPAREGMAYKISLKGETTYWAPHFFNGARLIDCPETIEGLLSLLAEKGINPFPAPTTLEGFKPFFNYLPEGYDS